MIVHATTQTGARYISAYGRFFVTTFTVEIGGCRSGINEDSNLAGCYAVSTGNWLPTFRRSFSTPFLGFRGSISLFG